VSGPADPQRRGLLTAALTLAAGAGLGSFPARAAKPDATTLSFRGTSFLHRWSKDGQHEFTPATDPDLKTWRDMITLNVHASVSTGDQLAQVANTVLGNYQRHGKILQTRSTPRTPTQPAEHLIVAVLGTPQLLEATFARCRLHDGVGLVAVVSHRVYGQKVGPVMSEWLAANGLPTEQALMGWTALPAVAGLNRLPTSARSA
jgi:hypothetical protein